MLRQEFSNYSAKGVDIIDFTKIMIGNIAHEEDETIYLVMSILDLFRDVCETYELNNVIKISDLLNYIVEVRSIRNSILNFKICQIVFLMKENVHILVAKYYIKPYSESLMEVKI